ncbi:MAG TPA: transaldolase [Myxococcaceae bacterium]|nr:transaldolase [Myxococcaceae bacterium]
MNRVKALGGAGQSVWLDYMQRSLVTRGELARLIDNDGIRGLTSNPTIFQKAVEGSRDYDDLFTEMAPRRASVAEVYDALTLRDIGDAARVFRPVWDATARRDGYCSLEVSPKLAHDTQGSIQEARRLWKALGAPNVMIKIPGTPEGVPAIEQCIGEGLNINVTLLFSQEAYAAVAEAYLRGLERRAREGLDLSGVASVASFFVSRIDSEVEKRIDQARSAGVDERRSRLFDEVTGKVAIANAKVAYRRYQSLFAGPRWEALARKGAKSQRVLWASTGTKSPKYSDVLYVEELIGPDTVNTVPPATLDAFRDHGRVRPSLTEDLPGAEATLGKLGEAGISMKDVTDALVVDGVKKFADSFDELWKAISERLAARGGRA